MGIEYFKKEEMIDDTRVFVKIWDTCGQELYKSLTRNFYKNSNGVIVVYDVTNRESFEKVKEWIQCIKENADENIKVILIGNKIDLNLSKTVQTDEGKKLSLELKINFFETSAKDNIGVNQAITSLISKVIRGIIDQKTRTSSPKNTIFLKKPSTIENEYKCNC